MALKEKDFIELVYTGMTKEDNAVFDTNDPDVAKKEGISEDVKPVIICLGQNQVLKGIDKYLIGKEVGTYEFDVPPEEGFGKKDAKLIQLIPTAKFRKQNIKPEVGLNVEVDDMIGTVRAVTGGRTVVDFNHPLSGRELHYVVKVNRVVEDMEEKIRSVLNNTFHMDGVGIKMQDDGSAILGLKDDLPEDAQEFLKKMIMEMTGIKQVSFKKLEKNKNMSGKSNQKGVENN